MKSLWRKGRAGKEVELNEDMKLKQESDVWRIKHEYNREKKMLNLRQNIRVRRKDTHTKKINRSQKHSAPQKNCDNLRRPRIMKGYHQFPSSGEPEKKICPDGTVGQYFRSYPQLNNQKIS